MELSFDGGVCFFLDVKYFPSENFYSSPISAEVSLEILIRVENRCRYKLQIIKNERKKNCKE